jgi:sulfur carrier protein ThiS
MPGINPDSDSEELVKRKAVTPEMIIQLNGMTETVPDGLTISGLIEWAKEGDPDLMVEKNRTYIYPAEYDTCPVSDNDIIEFINPNLGG